MEIGTIYKIENTVNGKVYIGQTIRSPQKRWSQHKQAMKYENGPQYNNHLYSAMRLYGLENFTFEVIENCDDSYLDEKEIYWIAQYNSNDADFGYNNTGGGQGQGAVVTRSVSQYDIEGCYIATYPSISEAARATGGDSGYISEICHGHYGLAANSQWRFADDEPPEEFWRNSMRHVCQYDMDGDLITVYENAKEASDSTGVSYINILNCLSGHHMSTSGFQWRYLYDDEPGKYVNPKLVEVSQYDLNGNYITSHESVISAAYSLGGDSKVASGISSCCKGRYKSAKGYIWRYKDDPPPKPHNNLRGYRRKIDQFDLDGNYITSYKNISQAAKMTGGTRTGINACVKGKLKTSGGYIWRYAS